MAMNALKSSIARLGGKLDDLKRDAVPARVSLANLTPYAHQTRKTFDADSMAELADSIRELGVLEPLLVRPLSGGRFEIIAGERRWRAAKLAELSEVPVLSRAMDDATADRAHLAENIHRENLSTLDLASRVKSDVDAAGGDLGVVAIKYGKGKPWVSKLLSVAQGGETMTSLVDEGVTADRAVLATVASLERRAPDRAAALGERLRAAPEKANKRAITERFMQGERQAKEAVSKKKTSTPAPIHPETLPSPAAAAAAAEPSWRSEPHVERDVTLAEILVELSPHSAFGREFLELAESSGPARLAVGVRHSDPVYAVVEFGGGVEPPRRSYRADELRLLSVA